MLVYAGVTCIWWLKNTATKFSFIYLSNENSQSNDSSIYDQEASTKAYEKITFMGKLVSNRTVGVIASFLVGKARVVQMAHH